MAVHTFLLWPLSQCQCSVLMDVKSKFNLLNREVKTLESVETYSPYLSAESESTPEFSWYYFPIYSNLLQFKKQCCILCVTSLNVFVCSIWKITIENQNVYVWLWYLKYLVLSILLLSLFFLLLTLGISETVKQKWTSVKDEPLPKLF